jgi:hypothetical protein
MAEKQQDLGKNPEEKHVFTLGDAAAEVAGGIALFALEKTLAEGKMIHVPSLGLVITPDRELKEIKDLTDEERANNPHIG